LLRDKLHRYQILSLSIAISAVAFCNSAQAMLMLDGLGTSVQKRASGLREFARSPADAANLSGDQWLQVPTWLAGTWCSSDTLQVYPDKSTSAGNNARVDLRLIAFYKIGTAKDAKGRIWQYVTVPSENVAIGGIIERRILQHCEFVNAGQNIVEIRTVFKVQEIDAQTGTSYAEIVEMSNVTHKYISPNHMWTSAVLSDYDLKGHLIDSYAKSCFEIRVKPFQSSKLGDLQPSFDDFIRHIKAPVLTK
jgi:hypothetical protein